MKNNIIIGLVIVICFILQTTVFQWISYSGVVPNLLIIVTAAFGFMRGQKCGIWVGFFAGLLVDLFFGEVLCFSALVYMYVGYTNGFFQSIFFKDDIKLPLLMILISDFVYCMINYFLLFLLRAKFHFDFYFLHIILPEIVYTIMIAIILYPVLLLLNRHFEKRSADNFV